MSAPERETSHVGDDARESDGTAIADATADAARARGEFLTPPERWAMALAESLIGDPRGAT
jgi:hypothetical protein